MTNCTSKKNLPERQRYAVGSMSHLVGHKVMGYSPIPDFPAVAPETDRTSEVRRKYRCALYLFVGFLLGGFG